MGAQVGGDGGRQFEQRALAMARAIHDPSGLAGSTLWNGREHDALFVDSRSVTAYEFTTLATKDKAVKDANKLADILKDQLKLPEHRFKSVTGYFITENEPTADQRLAVDDASKRHRVTLYAMSFVSMRKRLVDTEGYLQLRRMAPFGSAGSAPQPTASAPPYIEPHFLHQGTTDSLQGVLDVVQSGSRVAITGDYGAGKSEALKQLFERLRRAYFKHPVDERFPIHLNLRDVHGLRTPGEILRRHAEEIGFPGSDGLIAAWRSGSTHILLDGFDELVPARWVGGARDLRTIRWQALDPVRQLVHDTPDGSGVVIAGRAQFFSSNRELVSALGMEGCAVFGLDDFDDDQVRSFTADPSLSLPEWLPSRPLLLKFVLENGLVASADEADTSPAQAWHLMLRAISAREAQRVSSLTPDYVLALIARVATLTKISGNASGFVTMDDMRSAFRDVCNYEPEEQGVQQLLRLPGLTSAGADGPDGERRRFVDEDLADAAYGVDLAGYIAAPYSPHPLGGPATWTGASGRFTPGVAAAELEFQHYPSGIVQAPIRQRTDHGYLDAVLMDVALVSDALQYTVPPESPLFLSGVLISKISLGQQSVLATATLKDCFIDVLDTMEVDDSSEIPRFDSCLISKIEGWSAIPTSRSGCFINCDIDEYSRPGDTNDALFEIERPLRDRVALTILRKIYAQKGSGRKTSALSRGIPPEARGLVDGALTVIVNAGFARRTGGTPDLVLPVRQRRPVVLRLLAAPHTFDLDQLPR